MNTKLDSVLECHRLVGILTPPTLANGKICCIEIPATDIAHSADFYTRVFGWHIRQRGDGHTALTTRPAK